MQNDKFDQEFDESVATAKALESEWTKQSSKNSELVQQYPSGQKTGSSFPPCPRCTAEKFIYKEIREGCRMNGDAYGKVVNSCPTCGFYQTWIYDEA